MDASPCRRVQSLIDVLPKDATFESVAGKASAKAGASVTESKTEISDFGSSDPTHYESRSSATKQGKS